MNARLALFTAVGTIGLGLTVWRTGPVSPAAADDHAAFATTIAAALPASADDAEFVGSKNCRKCHFKVYRSWGKTKMAKAFDILKSGERAEAKTKAGLDPNKDYTKDESCLPCHTTGYGKPGGYKIPDPGDRDAVKQAKANEGIGCESCHGAGSPYLDFHETIFKEKKPYTWQEMADHGMVKIEAATCTECHNEKSPTFAGFDYEKQKDEGVHEHEDLKYRKD